MGHSRRGTCRNDIPSLSTTGPILAKANTCMHRAAYISRNGTTCTFISNAACLDPIYGQLAPMRLSAILFRKILALPIPQIIDIFSLNLMRKEINLLAACRLPLGRSLSFKLPFIPLSLNLLLLFCFQCYSASPFLLAIQPGTKTSCVFYCLLPSSRLAYQHLPYHLSLHLLRRLLYATLPPIFVATTRSVVQVC